MGGSCSCLNSGSKHTTLVALAPSSSHGLADVEILEGRNCSRAIEEEIELSKSHWSLLSEFELGVDEVAEASNVEVFRALQSHPEWGTFFQTFGEGGVGKLVMGKKFAEGGQAELYDAHIEWNNPKMQEHDLQLGTKWVLKVFKKGTSLKQLQLQWPSGLLWNHVEKKERIAQGNPPKMRTCCDVMHGILLEDGRFVFLMVKEDEDLRHEIDRLMLTTREDCGPYSKTKAEALMYRMAEGVEWLHSHGIIHRDLKASNVLVKKVETGWTCNVVDYECSIGVVGTGFLRSLEILQACKDYSISSKPALFTREADAYSYGMLCYEILTGKLPFEEYGKSDFDHVLLGASPKLPQQIDGWMQELLRRCWESNPVDRPFFGEILEIFLANSEVCREVDAHDKKCEVEIAKGIFKPLKRSLGK